MALREGWHIMRDALRNVDGGAGGRQEASAWELVACSTDDEKTARLACKMAVEKGSDWEDLARAAIETDSPVALAVCFEEGKMTPASQVTFIASPDELAVGAIARQATRCLDWLCRRGVEPRSNDERHSYGKDKSWLYLAAMGFRCDSVLALLSARSWSQEELDLGLGALVDGLRFGMPSFKEGEAQPIDALKALLKAGARWEAQAGPEPLGHEREPMMISTLLARMVFGSDDKLDPRHSPTAREFFGELSSKPEWFLMGDPGGRLGAMVLELRRFGMEDDAKSAGQLKEMLLKAPREEVGDFWDALARASAWRGALGPLMRKAQSWALAGEVEMAPASASVILLEGAMPKQASHVPGGSRAQDPAEMAAWARRMGGAGLAQAALGCELLLKERLEAERGAWVSPEEWGRWESAILAVSAATPRPPKRAGIQTRL